ncbi:MAG: glycosyltransferase [Bacteroidales bacterium]|nr:glycosyltransferase [Bacteroidales bacterium]
MELDGNIKYLIFGNAQSVHLIKWVKALAPLCNLYVLSSTSIHPDIMSVVEKEKCFSLHHPTNASGGNVKILKSIFAVKKIIQQIQPEIVNAHYITSHGLLTSIIKRFFGIRFVQISSAWGSDILVTPHRNWLYKSIAKFILNSSNIITSDAQVMTDQIKKLTQTKVLTFTFGLEKLPEISIEDKDYSLFFSNRILNSNYNIDKVILHFAKIRLQNTKAKLVIANEGDEKDNLKTLCHELKITDSVEFIGFITQNQQDEIYKKSGFYYTLPTSDATSVSLLEAMAWGCIPIVSNIPANREWIENLKNGIILSDVDMPWNQNVFLQKEDVLMINRAIISEKAIFSTSINEFFSEVLTLINAK